ncbi:MAG TPA: hypothetical protein VG318_08135 [Actinomycetota bacterium]|nr:hypothetical protein [Actinomycetota bacterium]
MHSAEEMNRVRRLLSEGFSARCVAEETGVPFGTVVRWKQGRTRTFGAGPPLAPWRPPHDRTYAYLLGLYLGDGHIYVTPRACFLRVHLDGTYPGIVDECRVAVGLATLGGRTQILLRRGSRINTVQSAWKRWPEAFPQHGPGRKHERPIVLVDWQREIVDAHPAQFVRGLIHSDGCRTVNRFTTKLPSGRVAEYAYPRYFFSNLSADIRGLFCEACEALGIRWTLSNPRNVSVSHRKSVAILEEIVGPKA